MIDKANSSLHANLPSPIELAMTLLSLLSVIVVLAMTFGSLSEETYRLLMFLDAGICIIFITNFFVGLYKARQRRYYIKHHWIDLVASIPAIEPLRFARLFQILRVIRLLRMAHSIIGPLLKQRRETTLATLLIIMVTVLSFSSVLILLVESGAPNANIHTAEDAIWWAMVTISTVGYGDFYPVTTAGHVIGTLVIIAGVSFFGVMSGYVASIIIIPEENEQRETHNNEMKTELQQALIRMEQNQLKMMDEINSLKQKLAEKPPQE